MRWLLLLVICGAIGIGGGTAHAQAWRAFTQVDDVCPKCTGGPAYDQIQLKSGDLVRARVLAENEQFVVLERFGEERAVGKDQIQNINKNPAVQRPVGYTDQFVLEGNIVLCGTIEGEIAPDAASFALRIPGTAIPVHNSARPTVVAIYRAGKKVFTGAPQPTPAVAPAAAPAPAAPTQ